MAKQLDNVEFMGENSTYHGVVSPADNLGQGIKRIAEILEVNGIPKYKIGEVLKSLGASIKVNGQEVTSLEFDSDPQTQFDTIRQDLTTAENQIGDLDATKQDKDVTLIHVDLGIQDLKNNQSFSLPKAKIDALASNLTALAEISDNITGRHRFFVRTSILADASLITMCEVVDMGTKKAPSINELEISVAEMKATYMEMALQPRLTQIDLDNIASIANKASKSVGKPIVGQDVNIPLTDGKATYTPPKNGYVELKYAKGPAQEAYAYIDQLGLKEQSFSRTTSQRIVIKRVFANEVVDIFVSGYTTGGVLAPTCKFIPSED